MPGPALSLLEREEISRTLVLDPTATWASIAVCVARHPTTIAREVDRNGGRHHYRAALADRRAQRCTKRPRPRRLETAGVLRDRVTSELRTGRSPYAIAADLAAQNVPGRPCVETIYTTVYAGALAIKASECLRMRRPRRRLARPGTPACVRRCPTSVTGQHESGTVPSRVTGRQIRSLAPGTGPRCSP